MPSRSEKSATSDIEPLLVPVWPDAGKALGYRTRSAAYRGVRRGHIPVVRRGRLVLVSRRVIERIGNGELAISG